MNSHYFPVLHFESPFVTAKSILNIRHQRTLSPHKCCMNVTKKKCSSILLLYYNSQGCYSGGIIRRITYLFKDELFGHFTEKPNKYLVTPTGSKQTEVWAESVTTTIDQPLDCPRFIFHLIFTVIRWSLWIPSLFCSFGVRSQHLCIHSQADAISWASYCYPGSTDVVLLSVSSNSSGLLGPVRKALLHRAPQVPANGGMGRQHHVVMFSQCLTPTVALFLEGKYIQRS